MIDYVTLSHVEYGGGRKMNLLSMHQREYLYFVQSDRVEEEELLVDGINQVDWNMKYPKGGFLSEPINETLDITKS